MLGYCNLYGSVTMIFQVLTGNLRENPVLKISHSLSSLINEELNADPVG